MTDFSHLFLLPLSVLQFQRQDASYVTLPVFPQLIVNLLNVDRHHCPWLGIISCMNGVWRMYNRACYNIFHSINSTVSYFLSSRVLSKCIYRLIADAEGFMSAAFSLVSSRAAPPREAWHRPMRLSIQRPSSQRRLTHQQSRIAALGIVSWRVEFLGQWRNLLFCHATPTAVVVC